MKVKKEIKDNYIQLQNFKLIVSKANSNYAGKIAEFRKVATPSVYEQLKEMETERYISPDKQEKRGKEQGRQYNIVYYKVNWERLFEDIIKKIKNDSSATGLVLFDKKNIERFGEDYKKEFTEFIKIYLKYYLESLSLESIIDNRITLDKVYLNFLLNIARETNIKEKTKNKFLIQLHLICTSVYRIYCTDKSAYEEAMKMYLKD